MTRLAVALSVLTVVGVAVVIDGLLDVYRSLARDEEQHDDCGVCPGCDPGPDDIEAVAEAVGVLVAGMTQPLSWELAKTPAIRAMTLVNSAAWLATARDIDTLPVFRGGR